MIRKSGWTLVLASFVMVFITGCTVGNKHAYQGVAVDLDTSGSSSVALATHDQRPYVVSGDKQTDFVRLQRGGLATLSMSPPSAGTPWPRIFQTRWPRH